MTKKEFYLKLFSENDIALTAVLILMERFATGEYTERSKDYILGRMKELYEEMPPEAIDYVFGKR